MSVFEKNKKCSLLGSSSKKNPQNDEKRLRNKNRKMEMELPSAAAFLFGKQDETRSEKVIK